MANSKSNIYPIQLQGAELNLNKLDAEIKQYSGFNKNNAPFVGGCLSNIFKKEDVIEGATKDNVYIAPNGDIYQAKVDGLYRNDELLFSYENNNFYEIKKIPIDASTVRIFSEDLRLCRSYGSWTYTDSIQHYTETYTGIKFILKIADQDLSDDNILLFFNDYESWSEEQIEDAVKNNVTCIYITSNNKEYAVLFSSLRTKRFAAGTGYCHGNCIVIDMDTLEVVHHQMYTTVGDANYETTRPVAICYSTYEGVNYISFYSYFINRVTNISYTIANISTFTNGVIGSLLQGYNGFQTNTSGSKKLVSSSFNDYAIIGYPNNSFYLKNLPGSDVTDNNNTFKPIAIVRNPILSNNSIYLTGNTLFYSYGVTTLFGKNTKNLNQEQNLNEGIITSLFTSYDYQIACQISTSAGVFSICRHFPGGRDGFSFTDTQTLNTTPETFSKSKYRLGDRALLGNFKLLFNNSQLSGIAGSFTLLTNWNTIDPFSIIYYSDTRTNKEKLYYKEGMNWYVIQNSVPKIRLINNQLVLNLDARKNSFDILRNKILFFAPDYNGCLFLKIDNTSRLFNFTGQVNDVYIAGAVNEYNQENNSSIILNPIGISVDHSSKVHLFNERLYGCEANYPVNIYLNYPDNNKIVYAYTYNNTIQAETGFEFRKTNVNSNLLGLPFPSDTNGNIEYSPSLFADIKNVYGNLALIKSGNTTYPLVQGNNSEPIMNYYLASGIDNFDEVFIIQGQYYGIINEQIFTVYYQNGVVAGLNFIVSVEGLKFCGNTPYEALFFSKTNRCLYSFTGANVLNHKQLVDKISEVRNYFYNPATQTVFLITDIGILFYGLFGMFILEYTDISNIFLLDNGIVMSDNAGHYRYIKYYLDEGDTDFEKHNICLETCFYGMNNQTVTINDCLYMRIFSEEHEEGDLEVSATTLSLEGRMTEKTTFKIKASDWDAITHTIYLRYQPKEQRGLGISFSINSPFKIASLSVGSQADAILVDKVSKGAINAPQRTSNNTEW